MRRKRPDNLNNGVGSNEVNPQLLAFFRETRRLAALAREREAAARVAAEFETELASEKRQANGGTKA